MKKTIKSVLSMVCAATLAFSAAACGNPDGGSSSSTAVADKAATFVSLDINPQVELTVNENNVVLSVYGENEDGKILLYNGENLVDGIVGVDVETAVEKITDLAVEFGFLNENNKVVGTSVSGENAETLQSKINTKITAAASELGLSVTTDMEGAFSLLRDLEQFKAAYPNDAVIQSLTVEDFRLALSASETGEVTLEAAVTMDDSALVEMISNAHKQADIFATEAFEDAKRMANKAYESAVGMAEALVYMTYTTPKLTLAPYGAAYYMYQSSACGFELIAESLVALERVSNYEFNETQIAAVLSALGLENTPENVALIANADGKVTVDSVEAYADILFKNTAAGENLETMKAELATALDTAEGVLAQAIKAAKAAVLPEIEEIIEVVGERGANALKLAQMMSGGLPEVIKTAVNDFDTLAQDVKTELTTGELTAEELTEYAATLKGKAATVWTAMEAKMTPEEITALEEAKQQAVDAFAEAKTKMDAQIATAEAEARAYLQTKKDALLNKNKA